jgi:hypothetical protein
MMPNGTTNGGTRHRMMTRHVTGDATDRGALEASMRNCRDWQRSCRKPQHQHHPM